MISRTAEYALRAAVCLADNDGQPFTTAQIAEAAQVSVDYLAKVMRALGRRKLVTSRRGLNGGFNLTLLVVGGGVAGFAAANRLRAEAPDARIVLLESGDRLGPVANLALADELSRIEDRDVTDSLQVASPHSTQAQGALKLTT